MNTVGKNAFQNRYMKINAGQAHLTLSEVADMLDLTRERVRQIEAKALAKIRAKLTQQCIKLDDII